MKLDYRELPVTSRLCATWNTTSIAWARKPKRKSKLIDTGLTDHYYELGSQYIEVPFSSAHPNYSSCKLKLWPRLSTQRMRQSTRVLWLLLLLVMTSLCEYDSESNIIASSGLLASALLLKTSCLNNVPSCACLWKNGKFVAECSKANLHQVPNVSMRFDQPTRTICEMYLII